MTLSLISGLMMVLTACVGVYPTSQTVPATQGSSGSNRYELKQDRGPDKPVGVAHIPDAVPRYEPIVKAGNYSPYEVRGKKYRVNFNYRGFEQQGYASWYGKKFHGKRTSNGEIYNMYGMTAAHKTLPIPVYVKVTNLSNQRQVIVRINDRGPFHSDRIIDLTYTAAKKLGFHRNGTARVKLKVLDPDNYKHLLNNQRTLSETSSATTPLAPLPRNSAGYDLPENTYLQAGAFGTLLAANNVAVRVRSITAIAVHVKPVPGKNLHKVLVGPINDNFELLNLRQKMIAAALSEPHVVYAR